MLQRGGTSAADLWHAATRQPVELGDSSGLLMGFDARASYQERRRPFDRGDRVLLFTDGLTEAENAAGAIR